ncbi:hypothetical protein Ddye_002066 [Dipteronia dyeriana]|uniref:Endonuclease/exonuclease/phosphatase domain-containing protein n=1 Tax=Dipteronia dyeriana TaxID=168575 RepID=A0AAE0CU35_9ROSI|nr:hypothetical protein Ddye_002066 [Dipteronia dyeriana]
MSKFREALEDCGLEDMGFISPSFTWSNKMEGNYMIIKRIYRSFCNREWRGMFPHFSVRHIDFWSSDHIPLVLEFSAGAQIIPLTRKGRRLFFEECWTDDRECKGIVNSMGKGPVGSDVVDDILNKIENCGKILKSWNIKKRRELRKDIKAKREALANACKDDITYSWKVVNILAASLDEALDYEERYWKQRAKMDWLKNVDRNSRFFHSKASARKTRNKIKGLLDDKEVWKESNEEIEMITGHYFSNIFNSSRPTQHSTSKVLE